MQDVYKRQQLGNVFDAEDIDLIPVICADAGCSGVMKTSCFMYIEQRILQAVKEHVKDLDGIYPVSYTHLFTRQAYTQLQRILLQHDLLVFPVLCGTTPQIGRKAQLFFMNHQYADTALKGAGEKWNMCQRKEKAGSSVLTVV